MQKNQTHAASNCTVYDWDTTGQMKVFLKVSHLTINTKGINSTMVQGTHQLGQYPFHTPRLREAIYGQVSILTALQSHPPKTGITWLC